MAYEVITLNLIPSGDIPVIHAAQYDVDRPLKFALKLGEDDFNPTGHTLELQIRKVDNNIVTAAPDDVTGNVVTFNSTEQMCACSGTNLGEIQIRKDDLDIATLHFYLVVQRDVLAGGLTSQSEIHDLADQIAEIVPEVIGDEYYTAAEVDEKIAEIPTFDPSNYYDKTQLYTKAETNGLLSQKANTSSLANVAFSGSYTDLSNTPNIPDVSDYYTKEETYSQGEVNTLLGQKADTSSLAAVATSGDYDDLLNKPTIPAAQVQSDWSQSDNTQVDFIKNKPTIPAAQVNSDWNASSGVAEILNKPTIPTNAEQLPIQSGSATNTKAYIDTGFANKYYENEDITFSFEQIFTRIDASGKRLSFLIPLQKAIKGTSTVTASGNYSVYDINGNSLLSAHDIANDTVGITVTKIGVVLTITLTTALSVPLGYGAVELKNTFKLTVS